MKTRSITALWAASALSSLLAQGNPPTGQGTPGCLRFDCYPPSELLRGKAARPRFGPSDDVPHFREATELAVSRGPNFAGIYTLVETSCGTACAWIALVDDRTGEILRDTPFGEIHFGSPIDPYGRVSYNLKSRLLVIEGRIEDVSERPIRAYYEWLGSRFQLRTVTQLRRR